MEIQLNNKYSKIRLVLSLLLFLFWIVIFLKAFSFGLKYINWQPFLILLAGSFLFALNKVWADVISFSIFLFEIVLSFVNLYYHYRIFESEESFFNYAVWQLSMDKFEIFGLATLILILLYLLLEFYKQWKVKGYK